MLNNHDDDTIFSIVVVQGVAWSTLLPIHAPRTQTGWPSAAIFMFLSNSGLLGFVFLVTIRFSRYSLVPKGITSVLAMLKTAPETSHQGFRACSWRVVKLSVLWMYTMVSLANSLHFMFSGACGISMPRIGEFLMAAASGSMPRSNSRQERASPCHTPRLTGYGLLSIPLMRTRVVASLYRCFTVFIKCWGILNLSRTFQRYAQPLLRIWTFRGRVAECGH